MSVYVDRKVLLSPVAETDEGLLGRNFYSEFVGFGKVSEVHEADQRLGNVAVSFADLPDSPCGTMFAWDPELIKDKMHVIDLISESIDRQLSNQ